MKKRKHAPRKAKPFPTFPVQPPGTFAVDPDDEMVSLANSAPPNFTPPKKAIPAISRQEFLLLPVEERGKILAAQAEAMVAYYRDDPEVQAWQTNLSSKTETPDPLTLKAAAIALPLLKAKEMTIPLVHKMLRDIIRARGEVDSVIATLIPALNPAETKNRMKEMAEFTKQEAGRLKALDELAKQAQELKMGYGADDPAPSVFEKIRAFRSRQKPLPPGEAKKLIRAGRHRLRRKRVLSPKFKKLMAKKTVGNTKADLDAVRGDR
jgi:hypothetical protein